MNIIEAVKSGKPFKRKSWDYPFYIKIFNEYIYNDEHNQIGKTALLSTAEIAKDGLKNTLTAEDILSDDWVLKEE